MTLEEKSKLLNFDIHIPRICILDLIHFYK